WIDADLDVREARLRHQAGDVARALELLKKAAAVPEIGAERQAAIQKRLETIEAFEAGRAAHGRGDFPEARRQARPLLVPAPANEGHDVEEARRLLDAMGDR